MTNKADIRVIAQAIGVMSPRQLRGSAEDWREYGLLAYKVGNHDLAAVFRAAVTMALYVADRTGGEPDE